MDVPNGTASFAFGPSRWVSLPQRLHQHTAAYPDVFHLKSISNYWTGPA